MDIETKIRDAFQDGDDIVKDRALEAALNEIEQLRTALLPFALAHNIAKKTLGPMGDAGHLDAIAKQYFKFSDLAWAAQTYGEVKE